MIELYSNDDGIFNEKLIILKRALFGYPVYFGSYRINQI